MTAQCIFCGAENDPTHTFCTICQRHGWHDGADDSTVADTSEIATDHVDVIPGKPAAPKHRTEMPAVKQPSPKYVFHQPGDRTQVEPVHQERDLPWSEAGVSARDSGHELFMLVDRPDAGTTPGSPVSFTIHVRNSGKFVERVIVEVQGLPADWWTVSLPELNLDCGLDNAVIVTVTPPRKPTTRPGHQSFDITARLASHPVVRCTDNAAIDIASFTDLSATIDPPRVETKKEASFAVRLVNTGNRPVQGRLVFTSETARVRTFDTQVSLPPGATSDTLLLVEPRQRLVTGVAIDHGFSLGVQTANDPLSTPVTAILRQVPLLSRLAFRALIAACIVLVLVGGLVGKSIWDARAQAVPDVVAMPATDAAAVLGEAGFSVVTVLVNSAQVGSDSVVAQNPVAGTEHKPGTVVELSVSAGPATFDLLDHTNQLASAVTELLENQGLVVTTIPEPSESIGIGGVIGQIPEPGALVSAGDEVELTVSTGLPKVIVPSVVNQLEGAATSILQQAGLRPIAQPIPATNDLQIGRIVKQDPPGGAEVDKGAFVIVDVAQATDG